MASPVGRGHAAGRRRGRLRRPRNKSRRTWALTFEPVLPADLAADAVVRDRHGADR